MIIWEMSVKTGKIKDSLRETAIEANQEFTKTLDRAAQMQIRIICNDF
jgi:hypothetical protein